VREADLQVARAFRRSILSLVLSAIDGAPDTLLLVGASKSRGVFGAERISNGAVESVNRLPVRDNPW
jgi:hypothetical protein